MESETKSENKDSTISVESDAVTSSWQQKDEIFGKVQIKIIEYVMIVTQTILMKMMKTNIIQEKNESLTLGKVLLTGLINTFKDRKGAKIRN